MKKYLIPAVLIGFAALIGVFLVRKNPATEHAPVRPTLSPVAQFEQDLAKAGKALLEQAFAPVPTEVAMVEHRFSADTFSITPLYLKPKTVGGAYKVIVPTDSGLAMSQGAAAPVKHICKIIRSGKTTNVFVDGKRLGKGKGDWEFYWIVDAVNPADAPDSVDQSIPALMVKDGFMRNKLDNGSWTVAAGDWSLKQYGGGMPETDRQMENYSFQRTVNPFSVVGKGVLTYGAENSIHNLGEACFYFGVPWRVGAVDKNSLPKANMFIAQGSADGVMVGFGWDRTRKRFVLVKRDTPDVEFEVLAEKGSLRPPISNWVKLGLRIHLGMTAQGFIDGKMIVSAPLDSQVKGPFHVVVQGDKAEFDDFSISPDVSSEQTFQPLYVRSRNFAGKKEKRKADPEEFGEWARGEGVYLKTVGMADEEFKRAVIVSRWPLMGDFKYESIPFSDLRKDLPKGVYRIELLKNPTEALPSYSDMTTVFDMHLVYDENGWSSETSKEEGLISEPALLLRRLEAKGNVIEAMVGGAFVPLTYRIDGPVHIAISRVLPRTETLIYPHPEHHKVTSANLINEFFESAPVDWNWVDGAFRMDSRWACQNRWNFMACGSREVPLMVSKRYFNGNQEHEYYLSLRPMLPSDAGDPSFTFNLSQHRELLVGYDGWYNRHNFNFSFCMDGRNPLSGYSIIFGADDNSETRLLRKGDVVASTTDALFPKSNKLTDVHWDWWDFTVRKYGGRVIVLYKDKPIFDYLDSDPIDGGHIAFWSVRNGFTISKVVSTAETVGWRPDILHVPQDAEDINWKPLVRDSVHLTKDSHGQTIVTANVGAGSMGVRHNFRPPVILKRTPNLILPLDVGPDTMVNVYLQIDDSSYVLEVNAPLNKTKALLTPEFEPDYNIFARGRVEVRKEMQRNELFQINEIPEETMRKDYLLGSFPPGKTISINLLDALKDKGFDGLGLVRSITVGNASNAGYLQAGGMGNNAGARFTVGTPTFNP